jgi:hypothetical protein
MGAQRVHFLEPRVHVRFCFAAIQLNMKFLIFSVQKMAIRVSRKSLRKRVVRAQSLFRFLLAVFEKIMATNANPDRYKMIGTAKDGLTS